MSVAQTPRDENLKPIRLLSITSPSPKIIIRMQRLCTKLRSLAVQSTQQNWSSLSLAPRRLLHFSPQLPSQRSLLTKWKLGGPLLNSSSSPTHFASHFSPSPFSLSQVRHVSSRERKKRRKPMTPVTSKVKKTKMKSYSSYKSRFRTMNDGTIRRWREGKNHNAHLKSKKARRRLRRPSTVPPAYAKVMKKLNFCG